MKLLGVLSLLLLLLGLQLVWGQDNNAGLGGFDFDLGAEEDPSKLGPSPDVITATVFPRYADGKFPAGSRVEILMGFRNKGNKFFNVTIIDASFNYPLDYNYYIQNFTGEEYNLVVKPYEEVSLSYNFQPDPLLEMRDFGLIVSVFYNEIDKNGEGGTNYTNVLYNATIDIVEAEGGFDAQTFFAYLAILAVLGLISYILYRNLASWTKHQKRKTPKEDTSTASTEKVIDNDWLTGTAADPNYNKRKNVGGSPQPRNTKKKGAQLKKSN